MAAIASAQAGNWSNTATWTGGVVPGDGDTATVAHAITVDVNTTVGSAPATGGTAAIACTAALTVGTGITLTLKGDITLANVGMTVGAGATVQFDAATGVEYRLHIGMANSESSARLTCNGTTESHVTIRKKSGSLGTARLHGGAFLRGGMQTTTFTDYIDLGASGTDAAAFWPSSGGDVFSMIDFTMQGCGRIVTTSSFASNCRVTFQRGVFSGSLHSTDNLVFTDGSGNTIGTGTRLLDRLALDKRLAYGNSRDFTVTENRWARNPSLNTGSTFAAASRDNLVWNTAGGGSPMSGNNSDWTRWFFVEDSGSNPHFFIFGVTGNQTMDRCVFEHIGTDNNGDAILTGSPSGARIYTVKNCIVLPNTNSLRPGKIVTLGGSANVEAMSMVKSPGVEEVVK